MQLNPENASIVTYTCCLLHNLLIQKRPRDYLRQVAQQSDPASPDLLWQDDVTLDQLQTMGGHTSLNEGKIVRDHLRNYYNSHVGSVPWQDHAITRNTCK